MGYRFSRLDEPVFMAGPKPLRTEFGIHHRLQSCTRIFKERLAVSKKLNCQTTATLLHNKAEGINVGSNGKNIGTQI